MDIGVGSFVFSQGVVSAIQIIKDPAYLTSPVLSKFISVTRKSLPIIVLGLIRVILVKGTDYPVIHSFLSFFFFQICWIFVFFRSMKQNTDDTGIFSSRLRFSLSSKFYFIPFFYISPYLLLELSLVWVRHNFFKKKNSSLEDVFLNDVFFPQVKNSPLTISVSKIIYFLHLEILWSVQTRKGLYLFQVRRRTGNADILIL